MIITESHTGWTTDNEIDYIDSLHRGTYPRERIKPADPKLLLSNYIKSARKRIEWGTFGSVDGRVAVAHAEKLLKESVNVQSAK